MHCVGAASTDKENESLASVSLSTVATVASAATQPGVSAEAAAANRGRCEVLNDSVLLALSNVEAVRDAVNSLGAKALGVTSVAVVIDDSRLDEVVDPATVTLVPDCWRRFMACSRERMTLIQRVASFSDEARREMQRVENWRTKLHTQQNTQT